MRTKVWSLFLLALGSSALFTSPSSLHAKDEKPAHEVKATKILGMKKIEDGNYLIEMAQGRETILANFRARGGKLECVNARLDSAVGMRGEAMLIGNGVFMVMARNGKHAATQFWVFGVDGGGKITEVPDRGEKHRIWRVKGDDVLKPPTK